MTLELIAAQWTFSNSAAPMPQSVKGFGPEPTSLLPESAKLAKLKVDAKTTTAVFKMNLRIFLVFLTVDWIHHLWISIIMPCIFYYCHSNV